LIFSALADRIRDNGILLAAKRQMDMVDSLTDPKLHYRLLAHPEVNKVPLT
jgi:hypothetical protein